jgi:aspartate/methionine/tyrosine aminotransferase
MVKAFAERREYIVAALNNLPGVRCATPSGAFIPSPTFSGPATTPAISRAGCSTRRGGDDVTSFGAFGEDYIGSPANSLETITEAVERIRRSGQLPRSAGPGSDKG